MSQVENETIGKRFIRCLIGMLLIAVAIYTVSHLLVKDPVSCPEGKTGMDPCGSADCSEDAGKLSWRNFARIDPRGRVRLRNPSEIDWYIGAQRAKTILEGVRDRTEAMDTIRRRIDENMEEMASLVLDRGPVDELAALIIDGQYEKARLQVNTVFSGQSVRDIRLIKTDLLELEQQLLQQCRDLEDMAPPLSCLFFWTSPTLSVIEVLFWSFFGVLTNLLVNSAEYLRKGNFAPVERWVAYTKLVYGPILSVVLVMAIINGFFEVESYQVRVWTLPLVGFIFGYAARRAANLVDKIIERFLGKAEKGIEQGPEAVAARRAAVVEEFKNALRPRNMEELKSQAKALARKMTEAGAEGKGGMQ